VLELEVLEGWAGGVGVVGTDVTKAGPAGDAAKQLFEYELRDLVARFDPVPGDVKSRARRAAQVQAPEDSELLELVYDSVLDAEIVVMPGDTPVRSLSFSGGGVRLQVKVDTRGDTLRQVTGWAVPVAVTAATLHTEQTTLDLPLNRDGSFCAHNLARAQVSLIVEVPLHGTKRWFHSDWFAL
jgi:hypothetical protein